MRVSVVVPAADLGGDALLEGRRPTGGPHSPNIHWLDSFVALRQQAEQQHIILHTHDILPLEDADIALYLLQPHSPRDIAAMKRRNPRLKTVLVLLETSLGGRYMFNPANHYNFDAILTYHQRLVDHKRYFPIRMRAYDRDRICTGLPFEQRRVASLVGTSYKMRFRTGFGAMARGWRYSLKDWLDYVFCPGELITYRTKAGRLCGGYPEGVFDVFGQGWEVYPELGPSNKGLLAANSIAHAGKYRYALAFENHGAADSLITERIWDALWGDCVPVYMGNTNIAHYFPKDAFIDARAFKTPKALLEWLVHAPKQDWERRRRAGREFILSAAADQYLPEACAAELLHPIALLAGEIRASAPGRAQR